ncbi:MAG TPA: sigma-70 family RNA polymerase sigma factor [Anaerolineales bacterium]|nr:sigma-70 family RNA polymerase sigma factor [Anaerolineales bacterium]
MLQTAVVPAFEVTDRQIFTDPQLLALIGHGENWALSEIHSRYARLVLSLALQILNDRASAEEIAQQVFTKVWRHARDYRVDRGKFSTWVSTITRRQCIDELRRRRVRPITDPDYLESLDQLAGNGDLARDEHDTFEQAHIREALQQLPAQERIVIELAYWGGMTHREIALHCHSPLGTVKTRLRVGMQRLKLLLQESV